MRAIQTDHAEPRDSMDSPCYRVNFWVQPRPGYSWVLDAYVLVEVRDVSEALGWVDEHANGRTFELFAEMDFEPEAPFGTSRKTGLVRLLGSNPNAGESVEMGRFEKILPPAVIGLRHSDRTDLMEAPPCLCCRVHGSLVLDIDGP